MTALVVRDLSVARGSVAVVRAVNFSAVAGEVTVLLGPNGAGKTSLMEAVSSVIASSGGSVAIGGQEVLTL